MVLQTDTSFKIKDNCQRKREELSRRRKDWTKELEKQIKARTKAEKKKKRTFRG